MTPAAQPQPCFFCRGAKNGRGRTLSAQRGDDQRDRQIEKQNLGEQHGCGDLRQHDRGKNSRLSLTTKTPGTAETGAAIAITVQRGSPSPIRARKNHIANAIPPPISPQVSAQYATRVASGMTTAVPNGPKMLRMATAAAGIAKPLPKFADAVTGRGGPGMSIDEISWSVRAIRHARSGANATIPSLQRKGARAWSSASA